jgi:hypothetical protein
MNAFSSSLEPHLCVFVRPRRLFVIWGDLSNFCNGAIMQTSALNTKIFQQAERGVENYELVILSRHHLSDLTVATAGILDVVVFVLVGEKENAVGKDVEASLKNRAFGGAVSTNIYEVGLSRMKSDVM